MKTLKILTLSFLTLLAVSCSKSDDSDIVVQEPQNEAPKSFSYSLNRFDIALHNTGNSFAPSIDWNGEIGTFSLDENYEDVYIDANTGIISWLRELPFGENIITINATNTKGTASTQVILNHFFSGNFEGGYNHNTASSTLTHMGFILKFFPDGSLLVDANGIGGTGSWTITHNGLIEITYTYGNGDSYEIYMETGYDPSRGSMVVGFWKPLGAPVYWGTMILELQ